MTRVRSALVAAAAVAAGTVSAASPEPTAVVDLLNRLPVLPATAQDAAKWFSKDGTLVHPGLVALKADIDAHRKLVSAPLEGHDSADRAEAAAKVDDLSKGMASVGIDMARMQKDPAYAKEIQERMKTMSPQEIMAMSRQMAQPMNADRRVSNEA